MNGIKEKINSISNGFVDKIYFTKEDENKIGSLTPSTNTITEWIVPTNNSGPSQIQFDTSTGSLYYVQNNTNNIGRLNIDSNSFTEWPSPNPKFLEVDNGGNVYFVAVDTIGRLS
jgi:streptogramin lyase